MRGTLVAVFVLAGLASGQEWPQLLGPTRSGVYTGSAGAGTPKKIWSKTIGAGFSPAAVSGGRVIVFHRQGDKEVVESLDPGSGKTTWSHSYATGYRDDFGFSDGPRSSPAIDSGMVFTYGAEGTLTALELATGKRVWTVDGRKEFGVRKEFFGAACSPLVDAGRVLMNIGGANGAGIVALDAKTGKTLWKALTDEAGYSSATVATIGGARHALFFTREGLVDADPATGRVRFQHRWRARMAASVNAAVPLVSGDEVFVTASYDTGAALLRIVGDTAKVVWSGDESLSAHYATPVLKDGVLYGFHGRQEHGQELRAVDWKTGNVYWSVDGMRAGTVSLVGDQLFVLKENGELEVAPASPKAYRASRKVRVADATVRAFPAFAGGAMYVRTDSGLAAWKMD